MKYLLRPLLFMALISLTGCLDENSKDRLDEQQVYTTDKDVYVNAVATLYNYIGGDKDSEGLQGTYRGVYKSIQKPPSYQSPPRIGMMASSVVNVL